MTKQKLIRELEKLAHQLSGITTDDECATNRIDDTSSQLRWIINLINEAKTIEYDDEDDGK